MEESLRANWDQRQAQFRERFEGPLNRASELTQRTLAWFPVRVWRHFLQNNGFLLAAGVSYQALFSIFAAIFVAFAVTGLWLGGSPEAIEALISLINGYLPGLISHDDGGVFTVDQVTRIATESAGVLALTGLVALGTAIWTAIGFVTFSRRAVRDIFAIPRDPRGYLLLKARDLFAALTFAFALVVGSAVGTAGTWALRLVFDLLGWSTATPWYRFGIAAASVMVSFVLFSSALAALVRFLTGTKLPWRRIRTGAMLGGGAITLLQVAAGWLLSYTPSNPLLATFAVFVGLLLWFRVIGVIILVSASWIAVGARDDNVPLVEKSDAERLYEEHEALLVAAHVRLRTAEHALATTPWYRRWGADRAVRQAQAELAEVEATAPPKPRQGGSLFD